MLLQEQWEGEQENRLRRQIYLRREFEEKLSLKRQSEMEERARRLQASKDDYLKCQEHLRHLLAEKEYVKDQHLQNIQRFKVWKCLFYFKYTTYILTAWENYGNEKC
jgi:hypothetical protein